MTHPIARRACALVFPLLLALPALGQDAAPAPTPAPDRSGVEEIIVTAQKREENINDIGMSIQAATGEQLAELGVTEPAQLDRVVTGFNYNTTYYGTAIYTIRGVGFQDTSLAGSPTVSVYIDQMPLPFSAMTNGAGLDLERVEALKGPQGTLFGQNALPQTATATVNCRIFPGQSVDEVQQTLQRVAGPQISLRVIGTPLVSDPSPLREDVRRAVTRAVHVAHPGVPIVPEMAAYATDGAIFRAAGIPTYGVSSLFIKGSDEFAHGRDERIPVDSFYAGLEHWYTLLKAVAE